MCSTLLFLAQSTLQRLLRLHLILSHPNQTLYYVSILLLSQLLLQLHVLAFVVACDNDDDDEHQD